jgi:hypothetical protein
MPPNKALGLRCRFTSPVPLASVHTVAPGPLDCALVNLTQQSFFLRVIVRFEESLLDVVHSPGPFITGQRYNDVHRRTASREPVPCEIRLQT